MRGSRLTCAALLLALWLPCAARADVFGLAELASAGVVSFEGGATRGEQALYAHDPAVSGDGRYVAFDGYVGGRTGVWRRELQPPYSVQPVAVGAVLPGSEACGNGSPCDAELPSISESGQYVSFTTTAQLDPRDSTGPGANVYVRNMNVPETQPCEEEQSLHPLQPCAFTLASAVSGETEGLTYEDGSSAQYGSVASARSALSADGQEVAFVTTAPSNLAGAGTPALQVAVRNLESGETELVSTEYDPATGQALPGHPVSASAEGSTIGAAYSPQLAPPFFPFDNRAYSLPPAVGASISADGTTVAWMGRTVGEQAPMLADEHVSPLYAEPLWRRIADGPLAPTRRVTGGSQPEDQACAASEEPALPTGLAAQSLADPCQGPFAVESKHGIWTGTVADSIPQLSADGYTVAFLSTAPLVSLGADFGRSSEGEADDLYVADMREGLTRDEALRPLTELASGHEDEPAGAAPIVDLAVSPDGSQVAFTTERTEFPLASPSYISQPTTVAGMSELFDVDLSDETLTRVTRSYDGGPSERPHKTASAGEGDPYTHRTDGALSPSFSEDGNTLAFASTASNLVDGDGNTPNPEAGSGSADGSDVFVVHRAQFDPVTTETYLSKAPPGASPDPEWRLLASAASLRDGKLRFRCETPGPGVLSVYVKSSVPNGSAASVARAARHSQRRSTSAHAAQVQRYVAIGFAWVTAPTGGFATLTLSLGSGFSELASRPHGLTGTAILSFSPQQPWHPSLDRKFTVTFVRDARSGTLARASAHLPAAAGRGR
jgi:hypothetical protein